MAISPATFDTDDWQFGENVSNYYEYMRRNDIYAAYAVLKSRHTGHRPSKKFGCFMRAPDRARWLYRPLMAPT